MGKAVVLLSGGLDSCVTAAVAAQSHNLALLHLQYGQRTQSRERKAYEDIADYFAVSADRRLVIDIDFLAKIGGSALTDEAIPVPDADLCTSDIPVTYVPFRNAHLLAMGVSWAETIGAEAVYIGVVQDDSSGYPDCTEAFCSAFARACRHPRWIHPDRNTHHRSRQGRYRRTGQQARRAAPSHMVLLFGRGFSLWRLR